MKYYIWFQVNERGLFDDCVEDLCAVAPDELLMKASACNALQEMAHMCRDKGVTVENWKSNLTCGKELVS